MGLPNNDLIFDKFQIVFEAKTNGETCRTGSFEWTTDDPLNAYTDAAGLHIVPTLTNETTDITNAQILDGYTLNLTTMGTCTADSGDLITACSIYSNKTAGTIINPVRSARLTTRGKKFITYGRVEVV